MFKWKDSFNTLILKKPIGYWIRYLTIPNYRVELEMLLTALFLLVTEFCHLGYKNAVYKAPT